MCIISFPNLIIIQLVEVRQCVKQITKKNAAQKEARRGGVGVQHHLPIPWIRLGIEDNPITSFRGISQITPFFSS